MEIGYLSIHCIKKEFKHLHAPAFILIFYNKNINSATLSARAYLTGKGFICKQFIQCFITISSIHLCHMFSTDRLHSSICIGLECTFCIPSHHCSTS